MFKPAFITFTGPDDRTSIPAMRALAGRHEIEFGVLFSATRQGTPRYPSLAWIEAVQDSGLRLAAHICGSWARQIVQEGASEADALLRNFARVQINTGMPVDTAVIRKWAYDLSGRFGRPVEPIIQCRGPFPEDDRVSWLYDRSGGNGERPDFWPAPPKDPNVAFGYAGGIRPGNVTSVLAEIPASRGGWIDMESGVREAGDQFSLALCDEVCVRVWGDSA